MAGTWENSLFAALGFAAWTFGVLISDPFAAVVGIWVLALTFYDQFKR